MDDKVLLDSIFDRLHEIKREKSLLHISQYVIKEKPPQSFYSEITSQHESIKTLPVHLFDDFSFISNDLVHFTAVMFLFRAYVNDSRQEEGTYFQNRYDARYLSSAGILQSAVYNFWDRIGDLLHCFFSTGLNDDNVYIGRVLNNLPQPDRQSPHFQEILDLYTNSVRSFISDRNEDAHVQTISTQHFFGILLSDEEEQAKRTELKLRLPEVFKDQIDFAYRGFELALRLVQERAPSC